MKLDVILAPQFLREDTVKGSLCVVIDVLRASSTIVAALATGATEVHPCFDAAEAKKGAKSCGHEFCLLGGEEMGRRIPGFDLGNSPLEYLAPEVIADKAIFLATTNGTAAIRRAHEFCGVPVYIGALINMSAISDTIVKAVVDGSGAGVVILCSGQDGNLAAEDIFCAGLVVQKIRKGLHQAGIVPDFGDGALIAIGFAVANKGLAFDVLATSDHGRYLQSIGFAADIEFSCELDVYDVVPVFDGTHIAAINKASL